jgi:DnaA family protein
MQLPLPVTLPVDENFDSFVNVGNEEVVTLLQSIVDALPDWRQASALGHLSSLKLPLVTLLGSTAIGKSHLLFATCHQLAKKSVSHLYLNMNDYRAWSYDIFEGLENLSVIALDNIHAIAGDARWEEALFDLLNRVVETQYTLVLCTSHLGPSNPAFTLPDLGSRLAWGVIYHVNQLDDAGREEAVRLRAEERGLKLSNQALQFLLHHSERDLKSLMTLLARLDTRSLQEQKRLSVAMVKRELGIL